MTTANAETNNIIDTEMGDLEDFPELEDTTLPLLDVEKMFSHIDGILNYLVHSTTTLQLWLQLPDVLYCAQGHLGYRLVRELFLTSRSGKVVSPSSGKSSRSPISVSMMLFVSAFAVVISTAQNQTPFQ